MQLPHGASAQPLTAISRNATPVPTKDHQHLEFLESATELRSPGAALRDFRRP